MKNSGSTPTDAVVRYFEQAATLRLCLQYNSEDYEYGQQGGRIVYLMDANIVRFFIDPEAEAYHVVAFGKNPLPDYAAGTALITAEFLFSRGLAGQGDRPALIAPSHGDEVAAIIEDHRNKLPFHDLPEEHLTPETVKRLYALIERVSRAHEKDRAAAKAELQKLVPKAAGDLLRGGWQRMQQMLRLYDEDLLRPLGLHTAATREVLEPKREDVEAWAERILRERVFLPSGLRRDMPQRDYERERDRARSDAEALVQTMLLDANAAAERELTRYVLVTADQRLFDAYAKWYWGGEGKAENRRFVLRIPLQYAPILNVQEMPNGISNSQVFQSATTALDSLFTNLSRADASYPHKLAFYRIQARSPEVGGILKDFYGANPLRLESDAVAEFERIRESWHAGFRSGVLLNAELMQRRMQAEFGPLARLLRDSTDLRRAIHEDQRRSLEKVENSHLLFSTRLNLMLLARAERHDSAGPASQRAPFLVRADLPNLLGNEPLKTVLERLARSERHVIGRIYDGLNASSDREAFLFAACVAFRCEHWAAATHYALRAHDLMTQGRRPAAERAEASYLAALATRYVLGGSLSTNPPSEHVIGRALTLLTESAELCRIINDEFGIVRALCEQNALQLVLLFRACLLKQLNSSTIRERILGFNDRSKQVSDMLPRLIQRRGTGIDAETIDTLRIQAMANVVSTAVLTRWLAPNHDLLTQISPDSEHLERALDALESQVVKPDCPPVLALEHLMARYVLKQISRQEVQRRIAALETDNQTERWSLDLDQAELSAFKQLITSGTGTEAMSRAAVTY